MVANLLNMLPSKQTALMVDVVSLSHNVMVNIVPLFVSLKLLLVKTAHVIVLFIFRGDVIVASLNDVFKSKIV